MIPLGGGFFMFHEEHGVLAAITLLTTALTYLCYDVYDWRRSTRDDSIPQSRQWKDYLSFWARTG